MNLELKQGGVFPRRQTHILNFRFCTWYQIETEFCHCTKLLFLQCVVYYFSHNLQYFIVESLSLCFHVDILLVIRNI